MNDNENKNINFLSFYLDNIENYFFIDDTFIKNIYNVNSDLIIYLESLQSGPNKNKKVNLSKSRDIRDAFKKLFNFSYKHDIISSNNNIVNHFISLLDFKIDDNFLKYYKTN